MSAILFLAAVVTGFVATLLGFGFFDGAHILGWLSASVTCIAAGLLVGAYPWPGRAS